MQTIEARAILSAADRTGGVFSQIAAKIRGMNATAVAANRTTAATGAMAAASNRASMAAASGQAAMIGAASRFMAPAAMGAAAVKSFKTYMDAELRIKRIGITADASDEEIKGLNKSMRKLGHETGQSFDQVAKGLESLVAGGMDLPQAMPALPAIAKTAQAAGAEVEDMATTTLALNQNLGIATDKMQNAFDILVKGGKAGKFELKDMARYFPSIAPAAVAAGMKGEEGLMRIVAALQTIRAGTGTTEEAAASMQNIFAKMESETTVKKFKEFGIDVRKEMTQARKEGKDLLEVFVDMTDRATKGDLSKIPQLFSDMEFARGMRAMMSFKDLNKKVLAELKQSAGSTQKDFDRVMASPAMAIARMKAATEGLLAVVGSELEKLPKKLGLSDKTISEHITSKAKDVAEKGILSLLPENDQKDVRAIIAASKFVSSERVQLETMLKRREELGVKDEADTGSRRLRLLDLKVREKMDEDLKAIPDLTKELEGMRTKWQEMPLTDKVPLPSGDPRKQPGYVPSPLGDPRKKDYGSDTPPVQALDGLNVEAKLTGEAEVKGQTEVKVVVEAGSELLRIVEGVKNAVANLTGKLRANGPGSTGVSSPDASPASVGTGAP
jgi:TP901 family phage tail tape measure protein